MMAKDDGLTKRLVVKHGRDGRCIYDDDAKQELIELCLRPGASVARLALDHGINANLLRNWISLYQKARRGELVTRSVAPSESAAASFIPVVALGQTESPRELRLDITLDNGIQVDLRCLNRADVLAILPVLASLPCSASTRR